MQFIKFLLLPVLGLGLLYLPLQLEGQEIRENEKGEKIIVYPDGSWQYFSDFSKASEAGSNNKNASSEEQKYPTFKGKVNPLKDKISITEEDARKIATRKSQIANKAAEIAQARAEEAIFQRELLEERINTTLTSKGVEKEVIIQQLESQLQEAKLQEKQLKKEAEIAQQQARSAKNFINKGNLKELVAQTDWDTERSDKLRKSKKKPSAYRRLKRPLSQAETTNFPPVPACKIAFEGIDSYTGSHRRDVQKRLLFTFTDEALRPYLRDREYLTCEGFLTGLANEDVYLSLEFTFAYPNAREAYGFIEQGSVLSIKLLDGKYVHLKSGKMAKGHYDTQRELLTYNVHYFLNRNQTEALKSSEVDSIRVLWSSGFEVYEVHEIDFFMNQLSCLDQ